MAVNDSADTQSIAFPVILWTTDWVNIIEKPSWFMGGSKASRAYFNRHAKNGTLWLAQSNGKISKIIGYKTVSDIGTFSRTINTIFGYIPAAPILSPSMTLPLSEFKRAVRLPVACYARRNPKSYAYVDFKAAIKDADSYDAVMKAFPRI